MGKEKRAIAKRQRSLYHWLPVIIWMGLIFYLSSQPDLPHHHDDLIDTVLKKMMHVAEYAVLAALLRRALLLDARVAGSHQAALSFTISLLYALSDEYHQSLVPGRDGNIIDVCVDALGVLLFLSLIRFFGGCSRD